MPEILQQLTSVDAAVKFGLLPLRQNGDGVLALKFYFGVQYHVTGFRSIMMKLNKSTFCCSVNTHLISMKQQNQCMLNFDILLLDLRNFIIW
jgi:hypothetical protein